LCGCFGIPRAPIEVASKKIDPGLPGSLASITDPDWWRKNDGWFTKVKRIAYFVFGVFLLLISGGVLAGAGELHEIITAPIHRVSSLPESGGLIVLGSVLIFGASILRRRKAERSR